MTESSPGPRLLKWFERLRFALRACVRDPILYPTRRYAPFDAQLCATTFVRNHALLHWHAQRIGARALAYIAPSNGTGRRPMSSRDIAALAHLRRRVTVDGVNQVEALDRFYRHVRAYLAGPHETVLHDLTEIFDLVPQAVYLDHAHLSDIGYDLIGRRIAGDLLRLDEDIR